MQYRAPNTVLSTYSTSSTSHSITTTDSRVILLLFVMVATLLLTGVSAEALDFATDKTYATGTSPSSITMDDLNNDGKPDLVVANAGSNTVSVFLGNGDSTFQGKLDHATGNAPRFVTVGDFNHDGKPDLVVVNYGSSTISVLLSNGDGTFQAKVDYATGSGSWSATMEDFNNDGKPDLAVVNHDSDTVSVLLGNGDGTFKPKVDYTTGSVPYSITVGDFNDDGKPDMAVLNSGSETISVLLGNSDGTFKPKVDYFAGSNSNFVIAADFNDDGKLDLAVSGYSSDWDSCMVSVLLGNGDGTFQAKVDSILDILSPLSSVTAGDFNSDGKPDLVVTLQAYNSVVVLLGNSDGTFHSAGGYRTGGGAPTSVTFGDFDGDGNPDLAVANSIDNSVSLLFGYSDGTFHSKVDYATGSYPKSVTAGDFNRDGKPDLVVANGSSNTVSVFLGNGDGTFKPKTDYPAGNYPSFVTVADFNGDGKPDLSVANAMSPNTVSVFLGNGDGTFNPKVDYPVGSCPASVTVSDFNNDGKPDLVLTHQCSSVVSVLLGNGDGTFKPKVDYATAGQSWRIMVGDFNRDGKPDLAALGYAKLSVLLGNGDGTFQAKVDYTIGGDNRDLTIGDFNGDGKPDLAVAGYMSDTGPGVVSVLLGNGDGTFKQKVDYAAGVNGPYSITVGDFNNDGKPDLVIAHSNENCVSVFLGNDDGTFQSRVNFAAGVFPWSVTVGDFNNDGKTDLAVANENSNTVTVLLNTTLIPVAVATPASFSFGSLTRYSTSTPTTITIKNNGTSNLVVNSVTLAGADPDQFVVSLGTCPSLTPTLAAGGSCTVNVTFGPTSGGAKSATVLVATNDPAHPTVNVDLSGTAVVPSPYNLTVGFLGAGSGSVAGTTAHYSNTSCDKAIPGSCTPATYQEGTQVSLTATPDWKSTFTAWSGTDSTLYNTATVTVNADRNISATFASSYTALLLPSVAFHVSLQDAYDSAATGGTIKAQEHSFLESLTIANSSISDIALSGGLDAAYQIVTGFSTVQGLTISSGKVTVRNVKVRPVQ